MDFDALGQVFDAWDDIIEKARKAKGLDNWQKLAHVSEKLQGKQAKDITFTSSHPSYEGKPVKHTLGSVIGNLHFLLGYVSPAFHLAPYHWQIIDPYIDDADAAKRQHPANPKAWQASGLPLEDEGDLVEGKPQKEVQDSKDREASMAAIKQEAMPVQSGYGLYIAIPSQQIVFSANNGHMYAWDIIKDSFFSASNPEVADKMNDVEDEEEEINAEPPIEKAIPLEILTQAKAEPFSEDVYPFIKNRFPIPGSIVPMSKSVYGLVTSNSIDFYTESGDTVGVKAFGRVYKSFDLTKDGDVHPSILANFGAKYLNISKSIAQEYITESEESIAKANIVQGYGTEGYENVPATYNEYERSIVVSGNTYKAVLRQVQ